MEILFHHLFKIDIIEDNVTPLEYEDDKNVKKYVMDLLDVVSENEGDREYIFQAGALTIQTYIDNIVLDNNRLEVSTQIAQRLLEKEKQAQAALNLNTQIQKGVLIISYVKVTETQCKVIITKADYNEFIEETSGFLKNGLPTKKRIFKAFIANIDIGERPHTITKLMTYDSNTKKSTFWTKDFLEINETRGDEYNTELAFRMIKTKILSPINKKRDQKADYFCLWNMTVAYFRSEGEFDMDHYVNDIIGAYQPFSDSLLIEDLKEKIQRLPEEYKFDRKFHKVPNCITSKFKETIKLSDEMDLLIKHDVPDASSIFVSKMIDGQRYLAIRSDEGYERFKLQQDNGIQRPN